MLINIKDTGLKKVLSSHLGLVVLSRQANFHSYVPDVQGIAFIKGRHTLGD